jgi:hypothetical protein
LAAPRARPIHQHLAHRAGRDAEEVRPVLPAGRVALEQADERLMDQRGGLKRLARTLAGQEPARHLPHLAVDERHEPGQRIGVAAAGTIEQRGRSHRVGAHRG